MSTASVPATQNGQSNRLAIVPDKNVEIVGDIITNPAMFEHVQRLAAILANGAFTPKHLLGENQAVTVATCFRVTAQAIRWGFDPFAVADETYAVQGKLGYQGKLIIAVINSRAGLKGPLSFKYSGSGAHTTVTVSGTFKGEDEPRTITLSVDQAKTANKMWATDPEQKLAYSGATKWARRHCPQVIMGVHTIEDLEAIQEREDEESKPRRPAPKTLADLMHEDVKQPQTANIDAGEPETEPKHPELTLAQEFAACATLKDATALRDRISGPDGRGTEEEAEHAEELFAQWKKLNK